MLQIRGVKCEAVVIYCEFLTTKEMGYSRLSRRVNNTVKKATITGSNQKLCPDQSLEITTKSFLKLF